MNYYHCPKATLHIELGRRGYYPSGPQDIAAERLQADDAERGTGATTISTVPIPPNAYTKWRPSHEYGLEVDARMLVNECIIHWTLNTFFPSLHLFFESGLSVHIEASHLPDALVGLDPTLRARLTDLTHEDDGVLKNTILPPPPTASPFKQRQTFSPNRRTQVLEPPSCRSIRILEATIANRTSVAVKQTHTMLNSCPVTTIAEEQHFVIGLRLEGMSSMAYVSARVPGEEVEVAGRMWGHVRVAGMRNDVPVPFWRFPITGVRPGQEARVVVKDSMVRRDLRGKEWDRYV